MFQCCTLIKLLLSGKLREPGEEANRSFKIILYGYNSLCFYTQVEVCNNICQDRSDCNPDYDGTGCPRTCVSHTTLPHPCNPITRTNRVISHVTNLYAVYMQTPATNCDSGCDFAHTLTNLTNSTLSSRSKMEGTMLNL